MGPLSCLCGDTIELDLTVSGIRTCLIIPRSSLAKVVNEYRKCVDNAAKEMLTVLSKKAQLYW